MHSPSVVPAFILDCPSVQEKCINSYLDIQPLSSVVVPTTTRSIVYVYLF